MKTTTHVFTYFLPFLIILFFTQKNSFAQDSPSETYDEIQETLKKDYLSFGILVQGSVDFQPERNSGNNGYNVADARFKMAGTLDEGFGYTLQAKMTNSPEALRFRSDYLK